MQTLPPGLLRADFGPVLQGNDLREAPSLSWLGLFSDAPNQETFHINKPVRLYTIANSSVSLVKEVLDCCGTWNYPEVRAFLIQHQAVCQALIAALPHVEAVFGKGTNVNLQVLVDHDGDGDVVLNALIQTPDAVEAALDKRRQFNRQWWSSARKIVKHLNFDIDCV